MKLKRKILGDVAWSLFEVFETFVIALVAVFFVRAFIAQPFLVSGSSMEPNFYDGDYLLVDELTYRLREPVRGEVIVFRYPGDHRSFYIKRVIGLPGEDVRIEKGKVVVIRNGGEVAINEPYVSPSWTFGFYERKLGPREYFMLGDNRNFSFDSRSWGPLKRDEVIGLVRFRLWPVTRVMAFRAPEYAEP